jgi:hypothetical protein
LLAPAGSLVFATGATQSSIQSLDVEGTVVYLLGAVSSAVATVVRLRQESGVEKDN